MSYRQQCLVGLRSQLLLMLENNITNRPLRANMCAEFSHVFLDKCGKLVNATNLIRPRCKINRTFKKKLEGWVKKFEYDWTNNARDITGTWLREGQNRVTRDLKWRIPVSHQGFEQKVFYVSFDAPFSYISMTKRYTKEYKQRWRPSKAIDVELYQFMAKDNVPFHSTIHCTCSKANFWPELFLDDGLQSKSLVKILGANGSGKSVVLFQIMARAVLSNWPQGSYCEIMFIDLTHKFDEINFANNHLKRTLTRTHETTLTPENENKITKMLIIDYTLKLLLFITI
uniref:Methionyl/Leucyl tRNA synthetase domain-containing protein n=1 Tax=Glossina palpalis gambiensis TaxID=67801 RepID=A0A1B0BRM4_9MUSC